MKIAFLGLGKMGVPVVDRLLRGGHEVAVWNRTPKSPGELGIPTATFSPSIGGAVAGCEVAFTMLADDVATETVVFGKNGVLAAMSERSIHISLGTLSVPLSRQLAQAHANARQHFLAAPVFGRPNVAAEGRLWIIAAGDPLSLERTRPLLSEIGRGLTVVGEQPWQAHAAKLAGNIMITSMIQSLSEAFVFASANGLDRDLFLKIINEALFQSPLYLNYGRMMLHPPEHPGATVYLGAKDTRLFREAAEDASIRLGLAEYLHDQFNAAIQAGMGSMDWAVGQYRMAEKAAFTKEWPKFE